MALTRPKKPKFKALPKAPKMTASEDAWKNYSKRADAVIAENRKRQSEYEKKVKAYENAIKMRESIKNKLRNAKTW
jgi:hypothetical protein